MNTLKKINETESLWVFFTWFSNNMKQSMWVVKSLGFPNSPNEGKIQEGKYYLKFTWEKTAFWLKYFDKDAEKLKQSRERGCKADIIGNSFGIFDINFRSRFLQWMYNLGVLIHWIYEMCGNQWISWMKKFNFSREDCVSRLQSFGTSIEKFWIGNFCSYFWVSLSCFFWLRFQKI